jgi:hypothetical protein
VNDTDRERGAVLVTVALLMVAILFMAAIVIDLGYTRSDRTQARVAADDAATAGANGLVSVVSGAAACADAMAYAFRDLHAAASASAISTSCEGFAGSCAAGTPRAARLQVGSTTVEVSNPVADDDPLMMASSLGAAISQPGNPTIDGTPCERLGVSITRPQAHIFGPALSGTRSYTVHSVARFTYKVRPGTVKPALMSLNQTSCKAIDAGSNGTIVLVGNEGGPGIAFTDSDGSGGSCSGTNAILASGSSARMVAESSGSAIGQLGWFAAPAINGYNNGATVNTTVPASLATTSGNYVGQLLVRSRRTTRVPADLAYHCTNAPITSEPPCAASSDPVKTLSDLVQPSPPFGFTTYTGPCDTTSGSVSLTGKVWIGNCPTFTVKGGTLDIAGGSAVIFSGSVSVEASGTLLVNTTGGVDASGYPIARDPSQSTSLVIGATSGAALNMQSTSSVVAMAQTSLFSRGGVTMQGSPVLRWTPPTQGLTRGLLYWSESTQPFSIQGGPAIKARGVVFHGNGPLIGGGGGVIDLSNVQMWVDTAATSGSTTLKLAADPSNSIGTASSGAALIR